MSVASDNARDDAKAAFYTSIKEEVDAAAGDTADIRISKLKQLAEAYHLVTFGPPR